MRRIRGEKEVKKQSPFLCPTDRELAGIEKTIGYTFRNPTLLRQAFTRRSYTNEYEAKTRRPAPVECNEVLETVGDAVLGAALLAILTKRHGKMTGRGYESDFGEGVFTEIKKNLCDKTALSRIIDGLSIDGGTPFSVLQAVSDGDRAIGSYDAPSPKEDLFESILGAVALDCDMDFSVIVPLVERLDNPDRLTVARTDKDEKTRLKEICEAKGWQLTYEPIDRTGPDHAPTYTVECRINGAPCGRGSGSRVKTAERAAASRALAKLEN